MTHYSRLCKIVIDVPAADHDTEVAFWQGATGEPLEQFERHPEYHGAALHGQDFWLLTQRLGEGAARVHLAFDLVAARACLLAGQEQPRGAGEDGRQTARRR